MPVTLPYLASYKNVEKLFNNISTAKVPDAFTHAFLGDSLGLKSNGDRPLIAFLRSLGFLDAANKPTQTYNQLKNPAHKKQAIAEGIKTAYKALFDANEKVYALGSEELRGLVSQVSGADEGNVKKITGTLNALIKLADFSAKTSTDEDDEQEDETFEEEENDANKEKGLLKKTKGAKRTNLNTDFHFNIQVHLPSNSSEEVYLNIFNAIRKVFG